MPDKLAIWDFIKRNLLILAIILLMIVTVIIEPNSLSLSNVENLLGRFGSLSVVSLGMTLVLVCGYLDLSVAGLFSLCAVVSGMLIKTIGQIPALLCSIAVGALGGTLTSSILLYSNARRNDSAVFITYGMSMVYSALALLISKGGTVKVPSDAALFQSIGQKKIWIIPYSFLIFLAVFVILHIYLTKVRYGRYTFLSGGNPVASYMCGIPIKRAIATAFVVVGAMAGLGAVLAYARQSLVAPSMGKGYETNALMAAVIGGTSMTGGRGSILRTVFGVILVIVMVNAMNMLGISSDMQDVMKGLILILAIWLDSLRENK
jgi:ribose transport system permease protein